MSNIVKLPIPKAAAHRVIRNTVASLLSSRPRLTADANGLCRLCGYDLEGGMVCCHTKKDFDNCSLHSPDVSVANIEFDRATFDRALAIQKLVYCDDDADVVDTEAVDLALDELRIDSNRTDEAIADVVAGRIAIQQELDVT
jgi:hypothetical protein